MATNWKVLGNFGQNDDVADALNNAGVGVGACVGLNTEERLFTVWGNDLSIVFPGYAWKSLGGPSESDVTDKANSSGAVSTAVTMNVFNEWVLWGYIPN